MPNPNPTLYFSLLELWSLPDISGIKVKNRPHAVRSSPISVFGISDAGGWGETLEELERDGVRGQGLGAFINAVREGAKSWQLISNWFCSESSCSSDSSEADSCVLGISIFCVVFL